LRLFSFGGYVLALAALALVVFGTYDSYPKHPKTGVSFSLGGRADKLSDNGARKKPPYR